MTALSRIRKSSLVTGAGTYVFASMINASIPFLLLPVLTRYLEPSEYGEVAVYQVWVALIGALCGLSVHGAAVRKYYDYDDPDKEMGEFISACIMLLMVSTISVAVLLLPLSAWISDTIGLSLKWIFVGVLFAFFNFLIKLRLGQWQVRKKPKKFGFFQISQSMTNMLLSLFLVVFFLLGVSGRITGNTVAVVVFGVTALFLLSREGLLKFTWRPDLMKEAFNFGVPLIPHVLGAFLLLTVDRAIISSQLGLDAAGHYMVAAQMAMVMGLVLDGINKAYSPWLYERLKKGSESDKRLVVKLTYGYAAFLLALAALAFLIGGPVLVFIAGEKYKPAADIIAWMVLGKAFHGMYYMVTGYIFYSKKTFSIAKITIFSGLVNASLIFFLSNEYGLIGAAWAMCAGMAIQWLMTWWVASRTVKMPWDLRSVQ